MIKKQPHRIDLSQRLFIELGTSLHIETKDKIKSVSGKLVGMKVGKYLIVDISSIKSDTNLFEIDDLIRIKYINIEDIFNFSSKILTVLKKPDNLIFLQYPQMVKSCNIRNQKRVDCFLPIHSKIDGAITSVIVTNISLRGCRCLIDQFHSLTNINGQTIEMNFSYGDLDTLQIEGNIRSSQIQGSQIILGIEFDKISQFSQSILANLVPALQV